MSAHPGGPEHAAFWSVFEHSHIPMALVDRERRYVAANDALLELYQYRREEIIGRRAGTGMPAEDPEIGEREWEALEATGELYGERLMRRTSGNPVRVSFAAHVTKPDGRWRALFVVVSAQVEPGGGYLIGGLPPGPDAPSAPAAGVSSAALAPGGSGLTSAGKRLTPREREIVHLVSLGRSTPQIAVELRVSPATVRSHVRNAMVKTGAHTRAQLVALVLGEGLDSQ